MKGYLEYVRHNQPAIWQALQRAAAEGLVFIDSENDAISASNRLLLTYPDLHEVINMLCDQWAMQQAEAQGKAWLRNQKEP